MIGLIRALVLVVAAALATGAHASTVIDFDDLSGTGLVGTYHGIDFGRDWRLTQGGTGNPSSAPNAIRPTGSPSTVAEWTMTLLTPAMFDGAQIAGCTCASMQYHLYNQGVLVHDSGWLYFAHDFTPDYFASGYAGVVDRVAVYGRAGSWAVDDLSFSGANSAPEPASWAMMLAGFASIGTALRRRSGQAAARA